MSKIKHQRLEALRFIKRCDRLIERLRDWEHVWPEDIDKPAGHLYEDAADRIDELRAENERLRLALEETVSLLWDDMSKQESVGKNGGYIYMKCRAALKELTGGKDE